MTRLLSYNVHRCLGVDGRLDVGRIADVIAAAAPDIVALQEVDVGRARTGGVDQAHQIARRLKMAFRFNAALTVEEEQYGDAILTALPERLVKAGPLPGHPRIARLEPRGALWLAVEVAPAQELQVINTHLGLVPREQRLQARALIGEDWLAGSERKDPLMLVGDFNAGSASVVYRTLRTMLTDAHTLRPQGSPRAATFPSAMPVLRIDHAFISRGVRILDVAAWTQAEARLASDHLALIVDFAIETVPFVP